MRFFKFYDKSVCGIFLIVKMKLQEHKQRFKIDANDFSGKNLIFRFLGSEGPDMGLK